MTSSRWTTPARRAVAALACAAAIGSALVLALSFVPIAPLSMAEHFRAQLAIGGAVAVAIAGAAVGARWIGVAWLDLAVLALVVELLVLIPDLGAARRPVPADGAPVRILVANVLTSNRDTAALRRLIEAERPDVIGLVEPDARWLAELAPALAAYPGRIEAPRRDNFGLALYARGALHGAVERPAGTTPAIVAEALLDGGPRLAIVLVHPVPPLTTALYRTQLAHFDAAGARAAALGPPFAVMGDLNATPWSRAYARLVGAAGACDTRAGFGAQTTFPAGGSWLTRIPIDHVLVSCELGVRDRRVGPEIGSDHLPVLVDLVVPRALGDSRSPHP